MIDYYSQLREPAYNSNMPITPGTASHAGRFDPLLSLVLLDPAISEHLDTRSGTLPSVGYEAGGSNVVRAYATSLHETIHWWQHVGSTTGLLSGLTTAAQAALCIKYMSELGKEAPKPLLGALRSGRYRPTEEDHPAWRAALRWREAELGNAFLVGPAQAFARVKADPFLFESIGHSIAMHHTGVTWYIGQVVDAGGSVFHSTDAWMDLYERSHQEGRLLFGVHELALLPFGARDLFEGQARLSELQYHDRAVEPHTLAEFRQMGLLEGVYGRCFEHFLKTAELPPPDGVVSPEVNLFLLLCDLAIHSSAGYPLAIPDALDLVRDNHPGCRFARLCVAARDRKQDLLAALTRLSIGAYQEAATILTEPLGWLPPDEVARKIHEAYQRTAGGERLLEERWRGEFGPLDVPAKFILSEHIQFAELKAGCPHFFCWPGVYLTSDLADDSAEVGALQHLLELTSPPFYATSEQSGVDTVSIHGLSTPQAKNVADRYFQNQATVDLFRQWISHRNETPTNEFFYRFDWKPVISDVELANLKSSFRAIGGGFWRSSVRKATSLCCVPYSTAL
jgi:hypothetical protein